VSTQTHVLAALVALARAVVAVVLALVVLAGPPFLLIRFVGNPLPEALPSWGEVSFAVTSGQIETSTWIQMLAVAGWLAWFHVAVSFAVETVAVARGGTARAVRGLGASQWFARQVIAQCSLVAAVLLQSSAPAPALALHPLPVPVVLDEAGSSGAERGHLAGSSGDRDTAMAAAQATGSESGREVTVGRRETLWSLAERHLGDGARWEVLRQANVGRTMADGTVLAPGFTRVERGWTLVVPSRADTGPADAAGVDPAQVEARRVPVRDQGAPGVESEPAGVSRITVERGDNLWRLSAHRLDEAGPAPADAEVLDYVNQVVARNAEAIDDPDLIFPGQVFTFPGVDDTTMGRATGPDLDQVSGPTSDLRRPDVPPVDRTMGDAEGAGRSGSDHDAARHDPPLDDSAVAGPEAPAASAEAVDLEVAHDVVDGAGDGDGDGDGQGEGVGEPYATIGSVSLGAAGALLAVGALGLVRRRRRYRLAHRSPGTVPAPPRPDLAPIERALERSLDGETAQWLESALRSLTARPVWEGEEVAQPKVALVAADHLEIEFSQPDAMAAPLPWVTPDEGLHWRLDRSIPLDDLPMGSGASPVPTLVTLGAEVMANLEGVGVVAVTGDDAMPMELIRSLVHELATSPQAGTIDVRSTIPISGVGTYDLVQVQRPAALVAELVPWLDDVDERLDESRSTSAYAYRLGAEEPLGPVVIVTDRLGLAALGPLPDYARRRRLPFALVVAGEAPAELTVEVGPDEARLVPGERSFVPQLLTEEAAEALGSLLADAESGPAEPLVIGVELSASVTDLRARLEASAADLTPAPVGSHHRAGGSAGDGSRHGATGVVAGPGPEGDAGATTGAGSGGAGTRDGAGPETEPPSGERGSSSFIRIRVLGDVVAEGAPELTSQQLSMLTFLACHGSASKAALIDGLWDGQMISQSRFPNLLAEVRARIGRQHLPESRDGRYQLQGVITDLAEFERLVRSAHKQDDAEAVVTLRQAMELVRGMPLTAPGRRFWSWVGDETHMAARIEALLADTAAKLARLEQAEGRFERVIWACERGLAASPTDETLVIVLTETYLAQGKPGLARRLVETWEDKISRLDCGEPSDEPRKRLAG
jgi:nucleoid-associated protein YgaU/DNA-binding SARP family transcriptional activator